MSQGCEGLFGNGMVHGGPGGGAKDISFEHEMSLLLIEKMHLSTVIAYKESGLTEKKLEKLDISWNFTFST